MDDAPSGLDWDWIREHVNELIDESDKAIGTDGDLFWFQEVAARFDLTPPVIEEPAPWVWPDEPAPAPPLGVLMREIAARLHPGDDVTGWLYDVRQLEAYTAAREAESDVGQ